MASFFARKALNGTVAVLDIKNGSVGGALVLFKPGEKPKIRYAHRLTYGESGDSIPDPQGMLRALRVLAEKLCTHGLPKMLKEEVGCRGVDEVIAFIGTPWVQARVVDHPVISEDPITVTEKWLQGVMNEILKQDSNTPVHILERNVLRSELNGYRTNAPLGKQAQRIHLSVFEASTESSLAEQIKSTLQGSFHLRNVLLRSALLATFTVIRDHFENEDNFLMFNVGSHLSEIALVRADALVATGILTRGSHTLIQAAAAALHTVPEEVTSVLRLSEGDAMHEGDKALQNTLAALESDWQSALDVSLASLKSVHGLPRTVFLFAPESTASWFSKLLGSSASAAHTLTREPFRVVLMTGEELIRHYHLHAEVLPDGPLALETLFLHKLRELHG